MSRVRLAIPRLGSAKVRIATAEATISYNGGKTWTRATVIRRGPEVFRVRVDNPEPGDRPRYGSLQIRPEDRAGNVVTETVKRAWQIRVGGGGADLQSDSVAADVPSRACGTVDDRQFRCLVLVEANSPSLAPMLKAVDTAAADVVSNSYGTHEFSGAENLAQHYDVDGVPMTVSSGDSEYEPANFPSSVPAVISVGGTTLRHADNDRGWREPGWAGAGSGCSAYFDKPQWQTDTACHMCTAADVSAVGDPETGVAVYNSFGIYGQKGWFVLGGTSAGGPLVAGMIAVAREADDFTAADLYYNRDALYDVVKGSNGYCKETTSAPANPATTHLPATAPPTAWTPSPAQPARDHRDRLSLAHIALGVLSDWADRLSSGLLVVPAWHDCMLSNNEVTRNPRTPPVFDR